MYLFLPMKYIFSELDVVNQGKALFLTKENNFLSGNVDTIVPMKYLRDSSSCSLRIKKKNVKGMIKNNSLKEVSAYKCAHLGNGNECI